MTAPFSGNANCSAAKISVNTGTITGALVYNITQGAGVNTNLTYFNTTVNTLALKDDTVYTFTMTVYNFSNGAVITTCTQDYIPDNSKPICTFDSALKSSSTYKPTQQWSITCTNSTGAQIVFGSNSPYDMAEASDVCTYTGDKAKIPETTYNQVVVTTSDGLNTTQCQLNYVTIDQGVSLKQTAVAVAADQTNQGIKMAEAAANTAQTQSKDNLNIVYIVVAVVVLYWWLKSRKKK